MSLINFLFITNSVKEGERGPIGAVPLPWRKRLHRQPRVTRRGGRALARTAAEKAVWSGSESTRALRTAPPHATKSVCRRKNDAVARVRPRRSATGVQGENARIPPRESPERYEGDAQDSLRT